MKKTREAVRGDISRRRELLEYARRHLRDGIDRKTADALGETVDQVNAHGRFLAQIAGATNVHSRILAAGFFGRLAWLVVGKIPAARQAAE
jgi:hypothetical protein